MIFNLFRGKKVRSSNEIIDRKLKSCVITPYIENDFDLLKTEEGIDIVIGESLKKSKYSYELSEQSSSNPQ
ncbi:MAG: hypothetical protein ACM3UU_02040 [Ignavibacteriales bacterium]